MNKLKLFITGIGSAIVTSILPLVSHAQAFCPGGLNGSSTCTGGLTYEATTNGVWLTTAYNEVINFLTSTGGVLFMIVITILGIVVWLAVKSPRHIVNS